MIAMDTPSWGRMEYVFPTTVACQPTFFAAGDMESCGEKHGALHRTHHQRRYVGLSLWNSVPAPKFCDHPPPTIDWVHLPEYQRMKGVAAKGVAAGNTKPTRTRKKATKHVAESSDEDCTDSESSGDEYGRPTKKPKNGSSLLLRHHPR